MNYLQNNEKLHFFNFFFKKCEVRTNKSNTQKEDRKYHFAEKVTLIYCEQIPVISFFGDPIFDSNNHQ